MVEKNRPSIEWLEHPPRFAQTPGGWVSLGLGIVDSIGYQVPDAQSAGGACTGYTYTTEQDRTQVRSICQEQGGFWESLSDP